jgi:hypothetical protein
MLSCNTTLFLRHAGCLLQVRIENGADKNTVTTSPWTAEVDRNTASCNCVESVQLVGKLTGWPSTPSISPGFLNV